MQRSPSLPPVGWFNQAAQPTTTQPSGGPSLATKAKMSSRRPRSSVGYSRSSSNLAFPSGSPTTATTTATTTTAIQLRRRAPKTVLYRRNSSPEPYEATATEGVVAERAALEIEVPAGSPGGDQRPSTVGAPSLSRGRGAAAAASTEGFFFEEPLLRQERRGGDDQLEDLDALKAEVKRLQTALLLQFSGGGRGRFVGGSQFRAAGGGGKQHADCSSCAALRESLRKTRGEGRELRAQLFKLENLVEQLTIVSQGRSGNTGEKPQPTTTNTTTAAGKVICVDGQGSSVSAGARLAEERGRCEEIVRSVKKQMERREAEAEAREKSLRAAVDGLRRQLESKGQDAASQDRNLEIVRGEAQMLRRDLDASISQHLDSELRSKQAAQEAADWRAKREIELENLKQEREEDKRKLQQQERRESLAAGAACKGCGKLKEAAEQAQEASRHEVEGLMGDLHKQRQASAAIIRALKQENSDAHASLEEMTEQVGQVRKVLTECRGELNSVNTKLQAKDEEIREEVKKREQVEHTARGAELMAHKEREETARWKEKAASADKRAAALEKEALVERAGSKKAAQVGKNQRAVHKEMLRAALNNSVRLCVVAPTVNINLDDRRLSYNSQLPSSKIRSFVEQSVLPKFTRILLQPQSGALQAGQGADFEAWLRSLLVDMQTSIEAHVAKVFQTSSTTNSSSATLNRTSPSSGFIATPAAPSWGGGLGG